MVLSFDRGKYGAIEKLAIETQKKVWKETGNYDLLDQSVPLDSTSWVYKPKAVVAASVVAATLCLFPLN